MKKVEVSVDFIKEAHQSACANWKQRIEKELPDLFNKLEVGKWYKINRNRLDDKIALVLFQGNGVETYGFCHSGEWLYDYGGHNTFINTSYIHTLATEEEIKTALINEAVKRGFVEGCIYDWEDKGNIKAKGVLSFNHQGSKNDLYFNNSDRLIYKNGKWATLITEPTEKELLGDKIKDLEKNLEEVKSLYDKL